MRIMCHPDNLELLKKTLKVKDVKPIIGDMNMMLPNFTIGSDTAMPKTRGTGRYTKKGDWTIDGQFVTWVETSDGYITDPPSWMIRLGLVEEEQEPYFIVVDDDKIRMRHFDLSPFMLDNRRIIFSGCA